MINELRPTRAEINLDNLARNLHSVKNYVNEDIKYMAVVKADAYGHGALQCAKRLEREGIDWFGVALPEEGIRLREAGIRKHILCLGSFWAGQEDEILNFNITPAIYRLEIAEEFDRAAERRGVLADIHVKIDTGMNRIGVRWDEAAEFAEALRRFKNLKIDGLMTHFSSADEPDGFTSEQTRRFNEVLEIFREKGFRPSFRDLANSPGALGHPAARGNMVRLGGVLYGLCRDVLPKNIEPPEIVPVMKVCTKISLLKRVPKGEPVGYSRTFTTDRNSLIATLPIGYQDGYRRGLSNRAQVIINGQTAPVVGRISMDWTTVDVTDIAGAQVGDDVILIGESGDAEVKAEDLAAQLDTISYEITCGISRRVPRVYCEAAGK